MNMNVLTSSTSSSSFSTSLSNLALKSEEYSQKSKATGRWTKEEHQRFLDGVKKHGRNWKLVEEFVGTRDSAQIRSHAQKYFIRLERELNCKFPKRVSMEEESLIKKRKYSDLSCSTYYSLQDSTSDKDETENLAIPRKKEIVDFDPTSKSLFLSIMQNKTQIFDTLKLCELVEISTFSLNAQNNKVHNQTSFQLSKSWSTNPMVIKKLNNLTKPFLYENQLIKKPRTN